MTFQTKILSIHVLAVYYDLVPKCPKFIVHGQYMTFQTKILSIHVLAVYYDLVPNVLNS